MYFITLIKVQKGKMTRKRCAGYTKTFEEAEGIVLKNEYDIFDEIYNYAVIEKINSGIYQYDVNAAWYRMDYAISEVSKMEKAPDFARGVVGFAIGGC